MAQSLHHALTPHVTCGREDNLQQNFPFDLLRASLVGVLRLGLEENLNWLGARAHAGRGSYLGRWGHGMLVRENALPDCAAIPAAIRPSSNTVAKTRTRHNSGSSLRPA